MSLPGAAAIGFFDCPRCGGWARPLPTGARGLCRGCGWKGLARRERANL